MAVLYKEQLGLAIQRRRKDLGLTQRQLADRVNIEEPQTVSRWERGLNAPTDLEAVASGLETTASEILKELEPLTQRERRQLLPHERTQLDRVEHKLDMLIRHFGVDELPDPPVDLVNTPPASSPNRPRDQRSRSRQGKDSRTGTDG